MSNCIITTAGRAMIAAAQANSTLLVIDELVFGFRDGLDPAGAPDAGFVLAAGEIVHAAANPTAGLIAPAVIVYSAVLTPTVGDFSFNLVGIRSGGTLVAVAVQTVQHKFKTSGFSIGNTVIKNFALEIVNVADLTGISIAAAVWQQDFSGLFAPIAHHHDDRYAPLGHHHDDRYEALNAVATHNAAGTAHGALFTAKADRNFGNLDLPAALANLGFAALHGASGYQQLPGGMILQWGVATVNLSSTQDVTGTITLPVTFPTAGMIALAGFRKSNGVSGNISMYCEFTSASQFAIVFDRSGDTFTGTQAAYWLAIGY